MADDPDRRGFLKVATCALGGGLGLVVAVPEPNTIAIVWASLVGFWLTGWWWRSVKSARAAELS